MSLKVVPFKSLGVVSYSASIVTMAISVAVIPHLCLAAPQGVTPSEFREDV